MKMEIYLLIVITTFTLVFTQKTIKINSAQKITYNDSASLLLSQNIEGSLKCLIACQMIECKQVKFDKISSKCDLYFGKLDLLGNLNSSGLVLSFISGI